MSQKKSENFNKKILTPDEIERVSGGAIWLPVVIGTALVAGCGYWGVRALGKGIAKGVAGHGTHKGR